MSSKPDPLSEKIREAHERVQEEIAKTSDTVAQGIARMKAQLERLGRRKTGEHQALKVAR